MNEKKKAIKRIFFCNPQRRFTAVELNNLANTGDARKCISRLRQEGVIIKDEIINHKNGTKAYYVE